jgi:hypothetical protein
MCEKNCVEALTDDCGVRGIKVPNIPELRITTYQLGKVQHYRTIARPTAASQCTLPTENQHCRDRNIKKMHTQAIILMPFTFKNKKKHHIYVY